jgi:predicted dehydrogenase
MSQLSRRRFLEESMLAAAAAATAGSLRSAVAAEATPARGPGDRIRVAVIGVNGRGAGHLSELANQANVVVSHICDADEAVGQKRCEETKGPKPKYVRDMREVFDDKSVDCITTATPNHWHSLTSIWAMQAGKDVYVEKPVSHNVSEGRRMVEAARKYERICQTGTQCRSMQGTIDAIAYVHAGKIGQVKVARGLCYKRRDSIGPKGNYETPASVDYNLWLGPAPQKPTTRQRFHYDWHWQWDYGNGDLGNQGIHQMDLARWGLGVDKMPQRVVSYGGRFGYEDAGETANTQIVVGDYGDKKLVFEVRGLPTEPHRGAGVGVIFEGTAGYVVLSSYDGGAAFDLNGSLVQSFQGGGDHMANFIDAVRSRKVADLKGDIAEGHLSSALCHLGNISYRLGKSIPLPEAQSRAASNDVEAETFERVKDHIAKNGVALDKTQLVYGETLLLDVAKETFVGNAAADTMLTREYRAPFVVPKAGQV